MRHASIRVRSAAALSLIITLIWLGTALVTARLLTSELEEVFDSALQETGQRILQLAVVDVLSREEEGVTQRVMALDSHEEYFTYVVRDDRGRILLTSHRADPAGFPAFTNTGFHEKDGVRFYHEAAVRGTVALTIAEPLSHRRDVAREMAVSLALPLVVIIPLSIAGIFFGLGYGLRPLRQLRAQLARRGVKDISSLPTTNIATELRPVTDTVNQLLIRLDKAFTAERSFSHWLFYALLVVVPITGLLGYYYGDPSGEWHTYAKPVFIGLIALHVAASLFHQFWRKDGLLMRMLKPE